MNGGENEMGFAGDMNLDIMVYTTDWRDVFWKEK